MTRFDKTCNMFKCNTFKLYVSVSLICEFHDLEGVIKQSTDRHFQDATFVTQDKVFAAIVACFLRNMKKWS